MTINYSSEDGGFHHQTPTTTNSFGRAELPGPSFDDPWDVEEGEKGSPPFLETVHGVALCGQLNRSGGRKGTPWAPSFTHNSYSICPSWYESIKGWCGLEFTIDAFASAKAKVLPRFWDRRQDAFKKSWSKEILWINPPLGRTEDIVTKAGKDRAQGLMLVPLQTNQPWFRALRRIAVTWWDLPMGAVLFQDDDGVPCKGQDQGWRWRAVVFDGIVLDYDPPPRGKWEETVGLLPTMEEMSLLDEQYMIEESGLEYEETRV
jgi:hypothetical protein